MKLSSFAALLLALSATVIAQDSTTTVVQISGLLPTATDPVSYRSEQSVYASSVASAARSAESALSSAAASFRSQASSVASSISSVARTATAQAGGATGVSVDGVLVGAAAGAAGLVALLL